MDVRLRRPEEPPMKSPFPGMDPYIEAMGYLWGDFHNELIGEMKRAVSIALPRNYYARICRTVLHRPHRVRGEGGTPFRAGCQGHGSAGRQTESRTRQREYGDRRGGSRVGSLRAFIEEEFRETFIDIYELQEPEHRLVTSIEVLSPSNKVRGSKGWQRYLRERQALLLGKANLVEIDLLRGGTRMPMLDPLPASPYYLLVAREQSAPRCPRLARLLRPAPTNHSHPAEEARSRHPAGASADGRGDLRTQPV